MSFRTVLHLLVLSSGILAAVRGPTLAAEDSPVRYGRITGEGAAIFNLADEKGREIARPPRGQLVAVYKELEAGWLEIEVPGGYPVWVFGRYLKATGEEGLYEVTGNAVNLRPAPSSDVTNFPLPQRLQAGDKVRGIELAEQGKPLEETWVRVWSPPGVRAYVKSASVEPLPANEDGKSAWTAALGLLPAVPPERASAARPTEPDPAERHDAEARAALEEARQSLERERIRPTPDYDTVEAQLQAVVARGGAVAIEARGELRTLTTLREAAALKSDLERERQRRAEETLRAQQETWDKSREKDPLGGAFVARGVLECRTAMDGVTRYYLRFGGVPTSEISCPSGRYALDTFAGAEIGVHGSEVSSRTGELPTFEVTRIEVIATH